VVPEEERKTVTGLFLVDKPERQKRSKIGSLMVPGESLEEFEALVAGLLQQYQPVGTTETLIVKDLAKFHWLRERAIRFEARSAPGAKGMNTLAEYRRTNERAFANALKVLLGLQKQRQTAEAMRPRLVDK
jgi:hypothetical protein